LREASINKELVVENQQEQSLVARRVIKDHILHVKGVTDINITRAVVLAAHSARSKYTHYSEAATEKVKQDKKRKAETDAVRELEDKRKFLKTDISSLLSKSKELYEKCENTGNLTLLHKRVLFVERQMTRRSSWQHLTRRWQNVSLI